jgi:chromosome segregation ATPase
MDVETILNQIRERVVSEENARLPGTAVSTMASSNGSAPGSNQDEALARLSEQLTVTGRAWNRLPPIFSNRRGTLARIELWMKNACRPLTRWFTWEQVNFNRAVHDALSDVTKILMTEAQELAALRAQLSGEMRREFLTLRSDLNSQATELGTIEAQLRKTDETLSRISNMLGEFADQARTGHSQLAGEISKLAAALREEDSAVNERLITLAAELKEEQRVCFRQLSLEASEAAVLEDRGRRALDARLEKLEASLQTRKG